MPVDVFNHHNRVIDQNTNRENQGKQRHPVQCKSPGPGSKQRKHQCEYHRDTNNRSLTRTECDEHQHHHGQGGEQ